MNPITFKELSSMNEDQLSKLVSISYKNSNERCRGVGIENLEIEDLNDGSFKVSYSDSCGDPSYRVRANDTMEMQGNGEWDYTLLSSN